MLKSILAKGFVQIYRGLFIAGFVVLNLIGVVFLGVVGYYLISGIFR